MKVRIVAALASLTLTALTLLALDWVLVRLSYPCPHEDLRICAIDRALQRLGGGHRVTYTVHREPDSGVYAHTQWVIGGQDVVHLQPTERWSDSELFYVLAHEYAHSLKRHSRSLLESVAPIYWRDWSDRELYVRLRHVIENDDSAVPPAVRHAAELDADAFAVRAMVANNVDPREAMQSILHDAAGSRRHPPGTLRLQKADELFRELQAQR